VVVVVAVGITANRRIVCDGRHKKALSHVTAPALSALRLGYITVRSDQRAYCVPLVPGNRQAKVASD